MSLVPMIRREFPARVAELAFSMDVPQHWSQPELPPFSDDWSDPTMFAPLILFIAPASPIVLTVAARPAYENGTLADWVPWLLGEQKMEVQTMSAGPLGPHLAFVGSARQAETDVGPMVTRFAFIEDGGRLVNISLIAPESVAPELEDLWNRVLKTFSLNDVRGSVSSPKMTVPHEPVVEYAEIPPEPQAEIAPQEPMEWPELAKQLEMNDQLPEMEALIKKSINCVGFAITIADMYRQRALRLNEAGDTVRAEEAREQARNWANFYASQATSGGEGVALSAERDAFLATL